MIFLIAGFVLAVAGGIAFGYYIGWRMDHPEKVAGVCTIGGTVIVALLLVGLFTIPSSSVPDGCYRIGSTTSSGVGVGVSSKGGVTVVPITTSGKTYTPIACPA